MMQIEIKKIIPKDWEFEECGSLVKVWYRCLRKNPNPLTLKNNIILDKKPGLIFGFWAGDGSKKKFVLSNNNFYLLEEIYNLIIRNFKIKKEVFSLELNLPINFNDREKVLLKEIKKRFPSINKIRVRKWKLKRNAPNLCIYGSGKILSEVFNRMHEEIIKEVDKNHIFWDGYLKGIIAAEGHISIRKKYATLNGVIIAQKDNKIKDQICEILKHRGIKFNKDSIRVWIYGKRNFDIILKKDFHSLHPDKKARFLKGYENIKLNNFLDGEADKIIIEKLKKPMRISILAKSIGRKRQVVRQHILLKNNSLYKEGLVEKCGKEKGNRGGYGELWGLTEKGGKILEREAK